MPSPYLESYPYLDALIGGWFHQDFDIEGDTLEAIIAAYKNASPPDDWLGTKADIQRFLRTTDDERIEEEFVRLFQPGVDATGWGMTLREWLLRIYALL